MVVVGLAGPAAGEAEALGAFKGLLIMVFSVIENILLFYKGIETDQYHRYRSWEHCYLFFQNCHLSNGEALLDEATLHLAFYLSSWGMYRGSSQLLQKDYRVHTSIVNELFDDKYDALWSLDWERLIAIKENEINLLFQLARSIASIYNRLQISPTDTLVTKVLLGTMGCIPAYDTLFMHGVRYWNQHLSENNKPKFPAKFGRNSFLGLVKFCSSFKKELLEAQKYIQKQGISYPIMKLADMYFWSLGYQLSEK